MRHRRNSYTPLTPDQSYLMTRLCEGEDLYQIAIEMAISVSAATQTLLRARHVLGAGTNEQACAAYKRSKAWTRTHPHTDVKIYA